MFDEVNVHEGQPFFLTFFLSLAVCNIQIKPLYEIHKYIFMYSSRQQTL